MSKSFDSLVGSEIDAGRAYTDRPPTNSKNCKECGIKVFPVQCGSRNDSSFINSEFKDKWVFVPYCFNHLI